MYNILHRLPHCADAGAGAGVGSCSGVGAGAGAGAGVGVGVGVGARAWARVWVRERVRVCVYTCRRLTPHTHKYLAPCQISRVLGLGMWNGHRKGYRQHQARHSMIPLIWGYIYIYIYVYTYNDTY